MLRQNNKLMRSEHTEKAAALAIKIGTAIKRYNSAELSRPDTLNSTTKLWTKVRQLTGHCNSASSHSAAISAESLNDHYAAISTDRSYTTPAVKLKISIPQFHNPLSAFHNNGDIRILSFESWLKSPVYTFCDNF